MITTERGHDPLADAFDRFTSEAAAEIVAPGAAVARRMGRHRRTARIAGTWLAVLLVGAGSAVAAVSSAATHSAKPASPIGPVFTKFDRRILAENWLTLPDSPAAAGHFMTAGYDAVPGEADVNSGGPLNGRYRLTFDCVLASGTGQLVVTFGFTAVSLDGRGPEGPQGSTTTTVGCDDPDTIAYHVLEMDAHGVGFLSVTIQADAPAEADAGIAWRIAQLTEGG